MTEEKESAGGPPAEQLKRALKAFKKRRSIKRDAVQHPAIEVTDARYRGGLGVANPW